MRHQNINEGRRVSGKIKKEKKAGKVGEKSPDKSQPAVEEKTAAPEKLVKPLVASNTEEAGISWPLFILLLVAVLIGGGFATQPLWSPYVIDYLPALNDTGAGKPPDYKLSDRLSKIEKEVEVYKRGGAIANLERERGQMKQTFKEIMARILEIEKQIDYVHGMLQTDTPPSKGVESTESLKSLSSRINKLETSSKTVNVVMERLAELDQAIAESGSNANNPAEQISQTMVGILERIGSLETGAAQSSTRDAAANSHAQKKIQAQTLWLAVSQLREALRTSAPFAPVLVALKALAYGETEIMRGVSELEPYGKTGIPTVDTMRQEYASAANAVAAAASPTATSEDGLGGVLTTLKSLVSVRKERSVVFTNASANPALKAKARLDEGDLAGAVAALSELVGPQAAAATPWLERARTRLMAETTLSKLHVFVVSLLPKGNS
jgi:hypothetical protein